MQDRRAARRRGSATSRTNATGSTSRGDRDRVERDAAARARARSPRRRARARAASSRRTSQPRSRKPRQQREQVRLRAGDARDLLHVEDLRRAVLIVSPPRGSRRPSARPSGRCATRSRSTRPIAARSSGVIIGEPLEPLRQLPPGRRARTGAARRARRAARRTRGSTRRRAGSSRRPRRRPCPARRPRMLLTRQSARASTAAPPPGARPCPSRTRVARSSSPTSRRQLAAVLALGRAQRRPVDLEPRVEPASSREPDAAHDRLEPLRPRVAAERDDAEVAACWPTGRQGNSSRSIPWPIATTFLDGERERAAVDADRGRSRVLGRLAASASASSA